jgi:hypothetical protein
LIELSYKKGEQDAPPFLFQACLLRGIITRVSRTSVIPAQGVAGNSAGMSAACGTIGARLRRCALHAGIQ